MSTQTIEMKPYRRQKSWLSSELLHRAPKAEIVEVGGRVGAQLEHPRGGPLTWVQSPHNGTIGVQRVDEKWHWIIEAEAA